MLSGLPEYQGTRAAHSPAFFISIFVMGIQRTILLIWIFCSACQICLSQGFELSTHEKELGISPDFPRVGSIYMGFFENGNFTSKFVFETYDPDTMTFYGHVVMHRIVMPMTQFHPLKDYVVRRRVFSMQRTENHEWKILTHKRLPARDPAQNIRWIQTNMGPMLTGNLVKDSSRTQFGIFPEQRENWHKDRFIRRELFKPKIMTGGYKRTFTATDGLPHNATRCITQTSDGAIWIGTIAGLSRFDGSTFVNFHTHSNPPLPDNNVRKLLELSDGRLAVATKTDGLFIFDGTRFQRTLLTWDDQDQNRTQLPISGLAQSESGAIWVLDSRFIYCLRPDGSFFKKSVEDLNPNWGGPYTYSNQIGSVLPLTDNIALAAASGQLIRWNTVLDQMSYSANPDSGMGTLIRNNKDEIVCLTASGLRHMDLQLNVTSAFGFHQKADQLSIFNGNFNPGYWAYNNLSHLEEDTDDLSGLFYINESSAVGYSSFPKNLKAVEFMEDREGNVWAILGTEGALMFSPPLVENNTTPHDIMEKFHVGVSKSHRFIKTPAKDEGARDNFMGLSDMQKLDNLPEHYRRTLQNVVPSIISGAHLFTPLGHIESEPQFHYYALEPTEAYRTQLSAAIEAPGFAVLLKTDHIDTIEWYFSPEAPEGIQYLHSAGISETNGIFLATDKGVLCKRSDESEFSYWTPNNSSEPFEEEVRAIWVDSNDNVWIAGVESGIITDIFNWRSGQFESQRINNSPQNATVIFEDKNGRIWTASETSICLIEARGDEFKVFQRKWPENGSHPGPHHYRSVTEDNQGRLWFGLNHGILIVKAERLAQYVKGKTETLITKMLDAKSGLKNVSSEYIFYPRSGVDENGLIHLEMILNIVTIDPEEVPEESPPAPFANINKVFSGDSIFFSNPYFSPIQYDGISNELPQGSGQTLSFNFSAANLSPSNKIRYKHRLKGFSDQWSDPHPYNVAIFSKVPPGSYQFEVKAISGNGMSQPESTVYRFHILPFFYQTKTFKVMGVILALAIVFLIIIYIDQRRRAKMAAQNNLAIQAERTRITQHIHDDLGSTLARLNMRLEMAKSFQAEPDLELLSDLTGLTQESSKKMRELIWCTKPESCTFNDLADFLSYLVTEFFKKTPVQVHINVQDSEIPLQLGSSAKRDWALMTQNLLSNVLQHSKATKIEFQLREIEGTRIKMNLSDNGVGMSPEAFQKTGSTGLKSIQSRVEQQGGKFILNPKSPGGGVQVSIEIPICQSPNNSGHWLTKLCRF